MNTNQQILTVDFLDKKPRSATFTYKYGEVDNSGITVVMTNIDLDSATGVVQVKLPDDNFVEPISATIENGEATFILPIMETGKYQFELMVLNGNGIVKSATYTYEVVASLSAGTFAYDQESYLTLYESMLTKVTIWEDAENQRVESDSERNVRFLELISDFEVIQDDVARQLAGFREDLDALGQGEPQISEVILARKGMDSLRSKIDEIDNSKFDAIEKVSTDSSTTLTFKADGATVATVDIEKASSAAKDDEIVQARKGEATLKAKIDEIDNSKFDAIETVQNAASTTLKFKADGVQVAAINVNAIKDDEIVQARKGEVTLKAKIDEIDTSKFDAITAVKNANITTLTFSADGQVVDSIDLDTSSTPVKDDEIVQARKTYPSLKAKIDEIDNSKFDAIETVQNATSTTLKFKADGVQVASVNVDAIKDDEIVQARKTYPSLKAKIDEIDNSKFDAIETVQNATSTTLKFKADGVQVGQVDIPNGASDGSTPVKDDEIVQARKGEVTLKAKIDEIDNSKFDAIETVQNATSTTLKFKADGVQVASVNVNAIKDDEIVQARKSQPTLEAKIDEIDTSKFDAITAVKNANITTLTFSADGQVVDSIDLDTSSTPVKDDEIVQARKGEATLKAKIDEIDRTKFDSVETVQNESNTALRFMADGALALEVAVEPIKDPEIIQARKGEISLDAKIDEIDTSKFDEVEAVVNGGTTTLLFRADGTNVGSVDIATNVGDVSAPPTTIEVYADQYANSDLAINDAIAKNACLVFNTLTPSEAITVLPNKMRGGTITLLKDIRIAGEDRINWHGIDFIFTYDTQYNKYHIHLLEIDHIEVRNCTFTYTFGTDIAVDVKRRGGYAFRFYDTDSIFVENCIFRNFERALSNSYYNTNSKFTNIDLYNVSWGIVSDSPPSSENYHLNVHEVRDHSTTAEIMTYTDNIGVIEAGNTVIGGAQNMTISNIRSTVPENSFIYLQGLGNRVVSNIVTGTSFKNIGGVGVDGTAMEYEYTPMCIIRDCVLQLGSITHDISYRSSAQIIYAVENAVVENFQMLQGISPVKYLLYTRAGTYGNITFRNSNFQAPIERLFLMEGSQGEPLYTTSTTKTKTALNIENCNFQRVDAIVHDYILHTSDGSIISNVNFYKSDITFTPFTLNGTGVEYRTSTTDSPQTVVITFTDCVVRNPHWNEITGSRAAITNVVFKNCRFIFENLDASKAPLTTTPHSSFYMFNCTYEFADILGSKPETIEIVNGDLVASKLPDYPEPPSTGGDLYSLITPVTLVAANSDKINTGVMFPATNTAMTIMVDFTTHSTNTSTSARAYYILGWRLSEASKNGFRITTGTGDIQVVYKADGVTEIPVPTGAMVNSGLRYRLVFTRTIEGQANVKMYTFNGTTATSIKTHNFGIQPHPTDLTTTPLVFGAQRWTDDGAYENFWNGTIHDAQVYSRALTLEEQNEWVNRTT